MSSLSLFNKDDLLTSPCYKGPANDVIRWQSSIGFGLSVRCHRHSYLVIFNQISFVQVRIWVLSDEQQPRWLTKWLLPIFVCCHGHSNLVIFNQISSIFHIWITFIKFSFQLYFHSPSKHIYLSFKSVCNKEHNGIMKYDK